MILYIDPETNVANWKLDHFNPTWHETGSFYLPCNFGIGFCQLNLSKKFPKFFKGENWHPAKLIESYNICS